MNNSKIRLMLLTAEPDNFVPKKLKEEAEKKGIETEIINPTNCYISLSNGDSYISHEGTKFMGADYCIPRLSEDNLEYKVAIMDHLEKMGIKSLNSGTAMRNCSNKVITQILLTKADISTPKTALITSDEQLEFAVKSIGEKFPVIIKTLFGTHGVGVIRADSMASLKSIVQQLLKSGTEFMLQEFIEHDESARVYILGDEVIASVMRDIPKDDFRSNAHQGAKLKLHEPTDEEKKVCIAAANAVGANFSAVDYIKADDKIIVLEVNGSPGFEALQEVVDDNIAEKVITWLTQNKQDLEDAPTNEPVNDEPNEAANDEPNETPDEENEEEEVEVGDSQVAVVDKDEKEVDVLPKMHDKEDVIGTITNVTIKFVNDDKPIEARVDTGATHSSLNADDISQDENTVKFRFGDYVYKFPLFRSSKIRTSDSSEAEVRPVIKVDMIINDITVKNVELTLNDRQHMKYDVLLGRSTLSSAGVLIDPASQNIDTHSDEQNKEEE
jgi:ribosomal protein S6--L-glutamate ligase